MTNPAKTPKFEDAEKWIAKAYSLIGGGACGRRLREAGRWLRLFATDHDTRESVADAARLWLKDNWIPLLVSVAMASVVYWLVHQGQTVEFERNVVVHVRGVPEGKNVTADPSDVRVKFKGWSREDMNALEGAPPKILVGYPKGGIGPNGTPVKIKKRNVDLSALRGSGAATVVSVVQDEIRLKEDTKVTLDFKLETPRIFGLPALGRVAEITSVDPQVIKVTGWESKLRSWERNGKLPRLDEISVEGRAYNFTAQAKVQPPSAEDIGFEYSPQTVKVEVQIRPERNPKRLAEIPVRLALMRGVFLPAGTKVVPTNVTVTIVGPTNTLDRITADAIAVYAEIDKVPEAFTNAFEATLTVRVPHDQLILETSVNPSVVTLFPPPQPPPKPEPAPEQEPTPAPEPAPDSAPTPGQDPADAVRPAAESPADAKPESAEDVTEPVEAVTNPPATAP